MGKRPVKNTGLDRYRREELAKIHIGKKDLGLADDIYRDILFQAAGVESSADLDWKGRQAVLERFAELGWKVKPAKRAAARPSRRLAYDPQSKMLRGMWIELHKAGKVEDPSEAALCKFAKRMTGKDALQWLSNRDVTVVKKALEEMGSRS
ncbi:regulatory protein GemA [bacterium]|nr:regulatory protein GemA [bacterium]